ncbi:MAG TPA: MarC family transcriptional regulator [Parvularcula sp.]|nr:MarC family transcriptional regulator [Parvularcula sp.]HBS31146.1 MarC family transcriptional regulator [Parvularcula sp.]HBS36681.1 MarC family transcriptional regulator [Parvularcula sp.]
MDAAFATLLNAFVTLFIVIDPILVTPIFASLTKDETPRARLRIAFMAALYSIVILASFGFVGNSVLQHMGVGLASFRAAMGIILFFMGFRMFFDPESETQAKTPGPKASARDQIAFFPLAIPMLAGPGAIATIMLLMGPGASAIEKGSALLASSIVLAIGVLMMAFASRIGDALGRTGMNAITRILGMLLMALATQYVFDGVRVGVLQAPAAETSGAH